MTDMLPDDDQRLTRVERRAAEWAALTAERDQLRDENENLRTVMIAAAEEIHEHWAAHCDAEGYGPANLMHRLEKGIPAQYGYKAGDFERLRAEVEALRRGEFICRKCGLRKDADAAGPAPF